MDSPQNRPDDTGVKVKKDSGVIYIAQNAARHAQSPLEPLFRALYIAHPSFDMATVDLVTGQNNIRKFLSFVNPRFARNGLLEPFTIEVEVIKGDNDHDTVLFCRAETETVRVVGPNEFVGFGHEFEKPITTLQVEGSTGHHRIISYRFGGIRFVVRYETDGYIAATSTPSKSSKGAEDNGEVLSSLLESLSLSSASSVKPKPKPPYAASDKSTLKIVDAGQVIPIESTLEIKTRTAKRAIEIDEVLPQLLVSQTPNLVRAYHRNGVFECPEVEDVTGELRKWEEEHRADLGRLAILIKDIISVVKGSSGGAVIRYDVQRDTLVVWQGEGGKKMLLDDLYS